MRPVRQAILPRSLQPKARLKPGSAGRPIKGVSIKIVDDDGNEVAAGVIGKIYARHFATSLFTYIDREVDRKAVENDGYVTVGDVGYLDDEGYLYVSDRRTDLVLSGGVNIYLAEIEQVLIGMPGVADCAVFGIPDAEFGQSLVALVETHDEVSLTARQTLRSRELSNSGTLSRERTLERYSNASFKKSTQRANKGECGFA